MVKHAYGETKLAMSSNHFICCVLLVATIKTHGHVSVAKKDTRRTMCYLQEAESS